MMKRTRDWLQLVILLLLAGVGTGLLVRWADRADVLPDRPEGTGPGGTCGDDCKPWTSPVGQPISE